MKNMRIKAFCTLCFVLALGTLNSKAFAGDDSDLMFDTSLDNLLVTGGMLQGGAVYDCETQAGYECLGNDMTRHRTGYTAMANLSSGGIEWSAIDPFGNAAWSYAIQLQETSTDRSTTSYEATYQNQSLGNLICSKKKCELKIQVASCRTDGVVCEVKLSLVKKDDGNVNIFAQATAYWFQPLLMPGTEPIGGAFNWVPVFYQTSSFLKPASNIKSLPISVEQALIPDHF